MSVADIKDLEKGKFDPEGNVKTVSPGQPEWDDFITTFPTSTSELHTYKKSLNTVLEVLITYSDSSRTQISRIQKTRL